MLNISAFNSIENFISGELAHVLDRLYGSVCYVGIDIDPELKYPKGAARVTFTTEQSFIAAISGRFVHIPHADMSKRVLWFHQIKYSQVLEHLSSSCHIFSSCNESFQIHELSNSRILERMKAKLAIYLHVKEKICEIEWLKWLNIERCTILQFAFQFFFLIMPKTVIESVINDRYEISKVRRRKTTILTVFTWLICLLQVEIKPYVIDEQMCDECEGVQCAGRYAPYFCGDVACLQYYCESCWDYYHYGEYSDEKKAAHKPLVRIGDQTKVGLQNGPLK